MTQETYRLAYEEASSELKQILGQFEVLRVRREKVQLVVEALKPLLADGQQIEVAVGTNGDPAPFLVQQASAVSSEPTPSATPEAFPEPAPEPEPAFAESSDPFQRRIDNALRHGLGSRESRILPRALNGLLSRA
jgi:hypothetical protein